MRTQSQRTTSAVVIPATERTMSSSDGMVDHRRLDLVRRRSMLEARLLAQRCGWCALDDIRLRRLERALEEVLDELGGADPAAELIRQRSS